MFLLLLITDFTNNFFSEIDIDYSVSYIYLKILITHNIFLFLIYVKIIQNY